MDITQVIKHKFFANKEEQAGSLKRTPSSSLILTLPTVPSHNVEEKMTKRINHAIHLIGDDEKENLPTQHNRPSPGSKDRPK
jgi:hypothetical protein